MSDDNDQRRQKLTREFREFAFGPDKDAGRRIDPGANESYEPYEGFKEDESEAETEEQDELYTLAADNLPYRPLIQNTLTWVSNLEYVSLKTAFVIEEQFRGLMDNKSVDQMSSIALMLGARNQNDIINYFAPEIVKASDALLDMRDEPDLQKRLRMIRNFPKTAHLVFFANVIAEIEVGIEDIEYDPETAITKEEAIDLGSFIAAASCQGPRVQQELMERLVEGYNKLCKLSGQGLKLSLHAGQASLQQKTKPQLKNPLKKKPRPPKP